MRKNKRFTPHHNNQNIIFSACFVSNFSGSNRCRYIYKRFTFIWKLENQNFPGIQQVLLWLSRCSAKYFSYVFSWIGCPTYVELIWITFDKTEVRRLNRAKRRAKRMRFQFFVAVQCTRALVLLIKWVNESWGNKSWVNESTGRISGFSYYFKMHPKKTTGYWIPSPFSSSSRSMNDNKSRSNYEDWIRQSSGEGAKWEAL